MSTRLTLDEIVARLRQLADEARELSDRIEERRSALDEEPEDMPNQSQLA
ncbi:hypothetical protein GB927_007700 [Shinella sp. CPCC 100929]|uniref:Uncharacterized protein n=1 Tax=Shinella lacus TaxID=2654216 RepID=A0ABT1R402_9HYPH|nr:hypothetical protein [Shinella lacus]MCQ4629911.1 hypothetical protein [Shinella lacus]